MAEIAPHGRAHRIRPGKALCIDGVVAREQTGVAEVDVDFHDIVERRALRLENRKNIVDGLLGLRQPVEVMVEREGLPPAVPSERSEAATGQIAVVESVACVSLSPR